MPCTFFILFFKNYSLKSFSFFSLRIIHSLALLFFFKFLNNHLDDWHFPLKKKKTHFQLTILSWGICVSHFQSPVGWLKIKFGSMMSSGWNSRVNNKLFANNLSRHVHAGYHFGIFQPSALSFSSSSSFSSNSNSKSNSQELGSFLFSTLDKMKSDG